MKSRSYPQLFPARQITHISKELLGDNFTWMCEISFHQLLSWKEECSYGESRGQYLGYLVSAPWQEGMWPSAWGSASQNSAPSSQLRTETCLYHFTLIPCENAVAPYYSITLRGRWKSCSWLLFYGTGYSFTPEQPVQKGKWVQCNKCGEGLNLSSALSVLCGLPDLQLKPWHFSQSNQYFRGKKSKQQKVPVRFARYETI